jgi:hypothetical protein
MRCRNNPLLAKQPIRTDGRIDPQCFVWQFGKQGIVTVVFVGYFRPSVACQYR